MAEHILGPYQITGQRVVDDDILTIIEAPGYGIVGYVDATPVDDAEKQATARLFAAAPDLLAVLREIIKLADEGAYLDLAAVDRTAVSRQARAAIAKATA